MQQLLVSADDVAGSCLVLSCRRANFQWKHLLSLFNYHNAV